MSETVIDIPSSLSSSPSLSRDRFAGRKYQLPKQSYPDLHYLRQPNQPFSSSPLSSSSLSPVSLHSPETSTMSIDGEFDERIDVIHSPAPVTSAAVTSAAVTSVTIINIELARASAPPLSDSDDEIEPDKQEEDENRCIICYENFREPDPSCECRNDKHDEDEEFEEECYIKREIPDFCQTCKYSVHHKCIDEYRATKINDAVNNDARRRYDNGSININGTFSIKCLTCAREVEKIHISRNGDIQITGTQRQSGQSGQSGQGGREQSSESEYDQRRHQRERHQYERQAQAQEILQNRMQRRRMRGQRCEYCKNKMCTICFGILIITTISLILFGLIR